MGLIIAGLIHFVILVSVFVIALMISTVLAAKVGPMVEKFLDNRWVIKYFALAEKWLALVDKCIALVDKCLAGISNRYRTIFPD